MHTLQSKRINEIFVYSFFSNMSISVQLGVKRTEEIWRIKE